MMPDSEIMAGTKRAEKKRAMQNKTTKSLLGGAIFFFLLIFFPLAYLHRLDML